MSTSDKLLRSLELLRTYLQAPRPSEESQTRTREKISSIVAVADSISQPGVKQVANFSKLLGVAIEILLKYCNDPHSNIRMTADENLNRIIRAMTDSSVVKIQDELYKEMIRNDNSRSLRAALWRFAELCYMIRPQKGKFYVSNLVPCIIAVARRNEDSVQETLASGLPKIMQALGNFTSDNDIRTMLKEFLKNLVSPSAVIRRTAATCISNLCLYSRKPQIFVSYIISTLIEYLIPVQDKQPIPLLLGMLGCLRHILPQTTSINAKEVEVQGSFGVRLSQTENHLTVDQMIQVYELSLHYTTHADHNVVNAALETLLQLLQYPPSVLLAVLLNPDGITKSRIHLSDEEGAAPYRSLSQMSIVPTVSIRDDTALLDLESESIELTLPLPDSWISESTSVTVQSVKNLEDVECQNSPLNREEEELSFISISTEDQESEYSSVKIGKISDDHEAPSQITPSCSSSHTTMYSVQSSFQSEDSREELMYSPTPSVISVLNRPSQLCDIGSFTDPDVPLLYCARYLAASFLLAGSSGGLISDCNVRVSVKALALNCLANIFKMAPEIFKKEMEIKEDDGKSGKVEPQMLSDVLLFANHLDQQLRACASMVIANLLSAVLAETGGDVSHWLEPTEITIQHLIKILLRSLQDESAVCSGQTLVALKLCLSDLIESSDHIAFLPILDALPNISNNPYWLVKVKLLEVVSDLPYITIRHTVGTDEFQERVVQSVIVHLLGNEDARVRHAAAEAVVKLIPNLYYPIDQHLQDTVIAKGFLESKFYLSSILKSSSESSNCSSRHRPFISSLSAPFDTCFSKSPCQPSVHSCLARVVHQLAQSLRVPSTKFVSFGCCEALNLLASHYFTTMYPHAWNCFIGARKAPKKRLYSRRLNSKDGQDINASPVGGLLSTVMSLLTASPITLDLSCQMWLVQLAGNLFSGHAVQCLQSSILTNTEYENHHHSWSMLKDRNLAGIADLLLSHIARTLNIFVHVLEENTPTVPSTKPALPSLPVTSSLSPIKRKSKGAIDFHSAQVTKLRGVVPTTSNAPEKDDKPEEKKSHRNTQLGFFANSPHYMKIYDIVKSAFTNYKITLDAGASEKFVGLLSVTLEALSQILEIATLRELGKHAEEILSYLQSTIVVEAIGTVHCVQQLLKCLFGTNLSSYWDESDENNYFSEVDANSKSYSIQSCGFYDLCFQEHYEKLMDYLAFRAQKSDRDESAMWSLDIRKRTERKNVSMFKCVSRGADKETLSAYIRLFETMILKAKEKYIVTSDIHLQCKVLLLLSQLVQLRVNYRHVDPGEFIDFVLKQFEFFEEGQIQYAEELIPRIFYFLVQLSSYEKHHSKSIIRIPEIIQLCDGLMASGQPPLTHCIPALVPVVVDVFLYRGSSGISAEDLKELETQREVLVSMLLRLVQYHQVLELLTLVLMERDSDERWRRWSRKVIDTLLPMLAQGQIRLECREAQQALHHLLSAAAPSVLRPVDQLLTTFFSDQPNINDSIIAVQRWMGMLLAVLLQLMIQGKEDVVLGRLNELAVSVPLTRKRNDPLNAEAAAISKEKLSPEQLLSRFFLKITELVCGSIANVIFNPAENVEYLYLQEQLGQFLLYQIYMFKSGNFCRVANATMRLLKSKDADVSIENLHCLFIKLSTKCPLLTFLWCHLMTILKCDSTAFWSKILFLEDGRQERNMQERRSIFSLNMEFTKRGGVILFSEFVNGSLPDMKHLHWLLTHWLLEVVQLSNEGPVHELIAEVHRSSGTSTLFLQSVTSNLNHLSRPATLIRLIRCLEGVHPSQTVPLLLLLLPKFLLSHKLAVSRQAATAACRRIEMLLTLPIEQLKKELSQDDFSKLCSWFDDPSLAVRFSNLVSIINKLGARSYKLSPIESEAVTPVIPSNLHSVKVDEAWFLNQVKHRCCQKRASGSESAHLLSKLKYDDIVMLLSCKEWNALLLQDCLKFGVCLMIQEKRNMVNNVNKEGDAYKECPLYAAAKYIMFQNIHRIRCRLPEEHQVFSPIGRVATTDEEVYSKAMTILFQEDEFLNSLFQIMPAVISFISTLPQISQNVKSVESDYSWSNLAEFAILCLEVVQWLLTVDQIPEPLKLETSLKCANVLLKETNIAGRIKPTCIASAIGSITKCVIFITEKPPVQLLYPTGFDALIQDSCYLYGTHACEQLAELILALETSKLNLAKTPCFIWKPVRELIISLSRLPLVNSYVGTPPDVWKRTWDVEFIGEWKTAVPPLPVEYLQDIELLQQLVYRITLLGWNKRQQFEETWVALLTVLSSTPEDSFIPAEEMIGMAEATSVAVQGLTALLLQTLLWPVPGNPNASQFLHFPRDPGFTGSSSFQNLRTVHDLLVWKLRDQRLSGSTVHFDHVFYRPNVERISNPYRHDYSQMSLKYLWTSTKILPDAKWYCAGDIPDPFVSSSCLDVHSCVHFLLDLYSQWMQPQSNVSLRLLNEAVKSIIAISDLFTEQSQFQWMLVTFLELSRVHPPEDEILHQYLVFGVCKASAVLKIDAEIGDRIRKIVEIGLRSVFLPTRIAAMHGILFLLQSIHLNKEQGDDMYHILSLITEWIQRGLECFEGSNILSDDHQLVLLSVTFYLLGYCKEMDGESETLVSMLYVLLPLLNSPTIPFSQYIALLQGFEKLVVAKALPGKVNEQVTKFAVEKLQHPNPCVSLPAFQLLLSCMYSGKYAIVISKDEAGKELDPEAFQYMEQISAIFQRIKRGYPFEGALLCGVLPNILTDFFPPSEILTKVIGEFLSPQQPHPRLLASVVFQVFEQACDQLQLPLLQDWLVLSLSNFTQCSPVGMAVWCLNCFFISASTNPWLRAFFPHVQTRIGRSDLEDRNLLCLSAADFYHKLSDTKQKEMFVTAFKIAAELQPNPFADLLLYL